MRSVWPLHGTFLTFKISDAPVEKQPGCLVRAVSHFNQAEFTTTAEPPRREIADLASTRACYSPPSAIKVNDFYALGNCLVRVIDRLLKR